MAKYEKEIERWVTINGARVPIYKDGSLGGAAGKAISEKKSNKSGQVEVDLGKLFPNVMAVSNAKTPEEKRKATLKMLEADRETVVREHGGYEEDYHVKEHDEKIAALRKQIEEDEKKKAKQIAENKKIADELNRKKKR